MDRSINSAVLDSKSFEAIADLAYRESGLQLVAEKTSMIQSRLRHRLRAVGAEDFDAYATLVCSREGEPERMEMISALTTNVSHFFREQHHFDLLTKAILPSAIRLLKSGGRFRIWSAGCSNGQEPYSIAMSALEVFPDLLNTDFRILATDIDPKVVKFASQGCYPERLAAGVPSNLLANHFDHSIDKGEHVYTAKKKLKACIVFKELNLLSPWPMNASIDLIFCRNVVIYFDAATQNKLWPRFNQVLSNEGRLCLGHSERISDPASFGFSNVGPTTYQKIGNSSHHAK